MSLILPCILNDFDSNGVMKYRVCLPLSAEDYVKGKFFYKTTATHIEIGFGPHKTSAEAFLNMYLSCSWGPMMDSIPPSQPCTQEEPIKKIKFREFL